MNKYEEYYEDDYDEDYEEEEDYSDLISNRDKTQIRRSRKEIHKGRVQRDEFD